MLNRFLEGRIVIVALSLMMATVLASPTVIADEGEQLAWKYHCVTCHGINGMSRDARYPHIAGQNSLYLVSRLKYFRDEIEPGNQMNAQAAPLSDETIDILAEYFSKLAR